MAMPDFFNIPNAIFRFQDPVSVPAIVSFDITWSGPVTDRTDVNDPVEGFEGQFVFNQATMTWSAESQDGFRFVSDPSPTTSAFAMLGKERNGVFFQDDGRTSKRSAHRQAVRSAAGPAVLRAHELRTGA
jgi:hypothetical protein